MPKIRWLMIGLCFLANAISYIDRANLAIAAPSIRTELGLDATAMGLVLSAFFWTYAVMQLPAGWFIDKVGVRVSLAVAVGWAPAWQATQYLPTKGFTVLSNWCCRSGASAA